MKQLKFIVILFALFLCLGACKKTDIQIPLNENKNIKRTVDSESLKKIKVLNFGTFHMGSTTDEHKTEFDEHDNENRKNAHEISKKLSAFQPTVILVEMIPESNSKLQAEYKSYLENPKMFFEHPSEIELIAYELGRISSTERIYGIDHKMGYNYRIADEINNKVDPIWIEKFYEDPFRFYPEIHANENEMSLFDKLKQSNNDQYLDFLITINADMLTHAATDNNFEGADEAAKYYQRNLRMYSNLNRINLTADDRVFILMGASHTAFFRDFISRSPKFEMVNTFEYLK